MKKLILILAFLLACFECEPNPKYQTAGWGAVAAAAISAGAAIYGNHQRNEAQRAENEKAFQRERQQVAEMNAYNSASAQAARLRAAGLNPNVMYDSGPAAAAGEQSDIAHYTPAEQTNAFGAVGESVAQTINSMIGVREQQNKNMLAESEVRLNASLEGAAQAKANYDNTQASIDLEMLGYTKENMSALTELYREQHDWYKTDEYRLVAETTNIEFNSDLLKKKLDTEDLTQDEIRARTRNFDAETWQIFAVAPSQARFLEASAEERFAMCAQIARQCDLITAEEYLKLNQAKMTKAQIREIEQHINWLKHNTIQGYIDSCSGAVRSVMDVVGFVYGGPTATAAKMYGSVSGAYGSGRAYHGQPRNTGRAAWEGASGSYHSQPAPKRNGMFKYSNRGGTR